MVSDYDAVADDDNDDNDDARLRHNRHRGLVWRHQLFSLGGIEKSGPSRA